MSSVFNIAVVSTTWLVFLYLFGMAYISYVGLSVIKHLNRPIYCVAEIYTYKLVAVYLNKVKCGLEVQE